MMLENLGQSAAMIKLLFLMQVKNVSWNNNTYKSQITQLENVFNNKIVYVENSQYSSGYLKWERERFSNNQEQF